MLKDPKMSRALNKLGFTIWDLFSQILPHGRGNTDIFFALPEIDLGFNLIQILELKL
jgi:hypothetical protein